MNLLLGYDNLDKGQILIGKKDIKEIENLSQYLTVSRQDAVLFDDTLRNNVAMYNPEVKDEDIEAILNVFGLIKGKNYNSLDDIVSEKGENFSGGEKKRISLARAFLKDSAILILDEPLANIDLENVAKIEDYILSQKDKTILVVSHQFNEKRLKDFDAHYVFDGGQAHEKIHS